MCGQAVTAELMAAVLGRQRLGGKREVVLLPAAGSFFAYEPILNALQCTHSLPLAKYILYEQGQGGGAGGQAGGPQAVLLHGELKVLGGGGSGCDTTGIQVSGPAAAP
jgi:hypothetical protein